MNDRDIKSAYYDDTVGRKYHASITTKKIDMLTQASANKQHGEVITHNFNSLLDKKEFKALSDKLKRMYINGLRDRFNATNIDIAYSMGWDNASLGKLLKSIGLGKKIGDQGKMKSPEQAKAWQDFLKANQHETIPEATISVKPAPEKPTSPVYCFHFEQQGELKAEEIAKRISSLIPDGTMCKVVIQVEAI